MTIVWSRNAGGEAKSGCPPHPPLPSLQGDQVWELCKPLYCWTANSLLCIEAAEGSSKRRFGPFAWPDECFVRSSYQILTRCWCCFRRKMPFFFFPSFSHLVLSDSLPGNKDGNSWISHGNIRTILSSLIQKSKTEKEKSLCSPVASKELSVMTSVLFNCLFAIMEKLYLGSTVLNW